MLGPSEIRADASFTGVEPSAQEVRGQGSGVKAQPQGSRSSSLPNLPGTAESRQRGGGETLFHNTLPLKPENGSGTEDGALRDPTELQQPQQQRSGRTVLQPSLFLRVKDVYSTRRS